MHGGSRLSSLLNSLPTTYILPKEAAQLQDAWSKAAHGVEPSITQPKGLNLWWVVQGVVAWHSLSLEASRC